jgi:cysteine desulfurase/selenocysteine lyase
MEALAPIDDFPALQRWRESGTTYLDSAATSCKPRAVLEAVRHYDEAICANVHRATHRLAEAATDAFERARDDVADLFGVDRKVVVFTSGASAAIALVAAGLRLGRSDRVLAPVTEHHSNLVPFVRGCAFEPIEIDGGGAIDLAALQRALARPPRPALLTVAAVSHLSGASHPIAEIVALARAAGVPVLVDAAQAAPHRALELESMAADYVVCSGHKMLGPTGIGVLTGRRAALERLDPPWPGGGTVEHVAIDDVRLKALPWRLESGTPPIAAAIGLGAAARYLAELGLDRVEAHARAMAMALRDELAGIDGVESLPAAGVDPGPIVAFRMRGIEAVGLARALDERHGVLVRGGTLCAQPGCAWFGVREGVVRASAHVYTDEAAVRRLGDAVRGLADAFARARRGSA